MRSDRQLTIMDMANRLNLSFYAVNSVLSEDLGVHRVSAKFIPNLASDEYKECQLKCLKNALIGQT